MKKFIKRMHNIFESSYEYDEANIMEKVLVWFSVVLCALLFVILFITAPLWVIPYIIWWCKKHRGDDDD